MIETVIGCGLGRQALLNMHLADLHKKAKALLIETECIVTSKTQNGWQGKCKGMLQVLWEKGFIDVMKLKCYWIKALDDDGNLIPELSLEHIIEISHDFMNEKSRFEYVCQKLGARATITTKYHSELAGEGIDYSCGAFPSLFTIDHHFEWRNVKRILISLLQSAHIGKLWRKKWYRGLVNVNGSTCCHIRPLIVIDPNPRAKPAA